jgi:hypothetical protein
MAECPACFGVGEHDFSISDAYIGEHWSDEEIANAKLRGMRYPIGVVACMECEGTGVVTKKRRRDMIASAIAEVDQVFAELREFGLAE